MKLAEYDSWARSEIDAVERALEAWVPADAPAGLGLAMRYGVLDGGKRLRPLLVLAASQAVHGLREAAMRAACAVELIHAYSLIHDDMPCMDNDVLRRGKPTVHVQFGEARAMLAGDAMQALAFEVLTPPPTTDGDVVPDALQARLCRLLARASGVEGMAGGQAIDLASVGKPLTETELLDMHGRKTGALLQNSVLMGAACGSPSAAVRLRRRARRGLPGGGRHPGRDPGLQRARQDRRQGRRPEQAHLRFAARARRCARTRRHLARPRPVRPVRFRPG